MEFGVVEIGSTNTKAYLYRDGVLEDVGSQYIAFKTNYKQNGCLLESDVATLCSFLKEVKKKVKKVYAFGTSIFRKISDSELKEFTAKMEDLSVSFQVVSADEESYYTVLGVLHSIDYQEKMAVVIGGGGSTEIAIVENKKIIQKINLDFGAMDITEKFPDLKEDITKTSFEEMLQYTMSLVPEIEEKVPVMVLAGGDYLYFYETVGYAMLENTIYQDKNQPSMLAFSSFDSYDHDILSRSLNEIKGRCLGNEGWWDGARGMRFCMNAIARKLNAQYIIPTRINMLLGLISEIETKENANE